MSDAEKREIPDQSDDIANQKTLGKMLKDARINKRLTQKELANMLSLGSDRVISSWERDRTDPDYNNLAKICRILDITPNYIFGFDDKPENSCENDESVSAVKDMIRELQISQAKLFGIINDMYAVLKKYLEDS